MQSQIIALLVPQGSQRATLLVRRGNGQFALERIDARVASATRVAASWFRQGAPIVDPTTRATRATTGRRGSGDGTTSRPNSDSARQEEHQR